MHLEDRINNLSSQEKAILGDIKIPSDNAEGIITLLILNELICESDGCVVRHEETQNRERKWGDEMVGWARNYSADGGLDLLYI